MKNRFFIYTDALDVIEDLTLEERGELLTAIYNYHKEIDFEPSLAVRIAFKPIKNQFIRDEKAYLETCERNSENAKKRWIKPEDATAYDRIRADTNGYDSMPDDAKHADKI
jgi:Family of unknown function (DUF6291)